MINFGSLAAMIGDEDKPGRHGDEHIEDAAAAGTQSTAGDQLDEQFKEPSPTTSPDGSLAVSAEGNRSRGDSGESSGSAPPPIYVESAPSAGEDGGDVDQIHPAPAGVVRDVDSKDIGNVNVLDRTVHAHEATQ